MEIPIKQVKPTILVNFILDESGSMESQREAVITGFNEYVQTQQNKDDAEYLVSLTKFSDKVEVVFSGVPVSQVRPIDGNDYFPDGSTALFDAIGRTIEATESRMREMSGVPKVLTFIFTDGYENASRNFTAKSLRKNITLKEDSGNWTFSFIGASKDCLKQASDLGISLGNSIVYNSANTSGTISTATSTVTSAYVGSVALYNSSGGSGAVTRSLFKDAGVNSTEDLDKLASTATGTTTTVVNPDATVTSANGSTWKIIP